MDIHALSIADRTPFAKFLRDKNVPLPTGTRWATRGCRGAVLRTFVIGGRRYITDALWEEWLAAINDCPAVDAPTLRQREREAEAAEQELIAAGA